MIPEAIIYQDDNNGSLSGFISKIDKTTNYFKCSGDPIINISKNGKGMAIFAKLCSDGKKYFCADTTDNKYIEVDEVYALGGKSSCQ